MIDRLQRFAFAGLAFLAVAPLCADDGEMTMMSFNVRIGCGMHDPFKLPEGGLGHLPQCAEVIKSVNPDWVAIQEIDRCSCRVGHVDQTAELAKMCGLYGTFVKKRPEKDGDYGLAILSKEKPLNVSKILMPGALHTRCVEILEFRDYFVACTHFPLKDHFCEIAAEIVRLNLADRDKPVFLAGDFNSRPDTKAVAILKKGFTILSDVTQNTYPADKPDRCIDYIMVDTKHADKVKVLSRKVIAEPDATDHCALVVKARADELCFKPLFNGKDLEGWEGATNTYCVTSDGLLTCRQGSVKGDKQVRNLWTTKDYADFIIRFEVKLPPNANNGLGIRTKPNGWCSREGMEIQLLDDWGDRYNGTNRLSDVHYTGAIYGVVPPKRKPDGTTYLKPTGEWNAVEVTAIGPKITVVLNGEKIVDADVSKYSTDGTVPPDGIKRPGLHNRSGRIHWCGHGEDIFWRNIRIREL